MLKGLEKPNSELLKISHAGFLLYSPISILAFPVTVLVANPGASIWVLLFAGLLLTAAIFLIYSACIYLGRTLVTRFPAANLALFLVVPVIVGSARGYFFYQLVNYFGLTSPGGLINRVLASTATTLFWLTSANFLINNSRVFRARYQRSLNIFIHRNIPSLSAQAPSSESQSELEQLQIDLSQTLAQRLKDEGSDNLRDVADLLKSNINLQLRPLSRRIWLRSLSEYPVIRYQQMFRDSVRYLQFSTPLFILIMLVLALLDNFFIRSLSESIIRTVTFLIPLIAALKLPKNKSTSLNCLFLVTLGIVPIFVSEYFSFLLGFEGSWTATVLVTLVAPAVLVVLSFFQLTQRDHNLIIDLLQNYELADFHTQSKGIDLGERNLASYIHNSLQSELLALAGQLEEAANTQDHEKSSQILQKVSSLINRSFVDDFKKFSESPLDRLKTIQNSWKGLLDVQIDIPEDLLQSPEKNSVIVQTIEEFATNSYRHGQATAITIRAEADTSGVKLLLQSNGKRKVPAQRGLGTEWLDQIALTPWKLQSSRNGTTLEITI